VVTREQKLTLGEMQIEIRPHVGTAIAARWQVNSGSMSEIIHPTRRRTNCQPPEAVRQRRLA